MTRARDISKIVTDANLSGTLDVAGDFTVGNIKSSTNLTLEADFENDTAASASKIQFKNDGVLRGEFVAGGDFQLYEDTGTTPKLFWDASAECLNVGTSTSAGRLHVNVDAAADYPVRFVNSSSTGYGLSVTAGNNNTSIARFEDYAGNDRVHILGNGNVGIGTGSPTHALTVQYNDQTTTAKFQNTNTSGTGIDSAKITVESISRDASLAIVAESSRSSFIDFGDEVSSTRGRILYAHSDDSMQILTANSEAMRITSGGNVGIGTSSPDGYAGNFLQIHDTGTRSSLRLTNSNSGSTKDDGFEIENRDGYVQVNYRENGYMSFLTNNSERMRIDSSGNVILSSNEPTLFLKDSNNANTTRYIKNSAEIFTIGRINDDLSASSVEHLRIDDSGRLQVGLTNGESGINTLSGLSWYRTNLYSQRWNSFISHGGTGEYGTLYFNGTLTTGDFVVQPGLTERMKLKYNGETYFTGVYSQTTASGANVNVLSTGLLRRSTSSLRYKNTVNDATHGLTELLTLRPVTYKGNDDGDTIFGGLIAEEVHDAGLTEFVQYNDDGEPDALAYGNMVSLCIKAIQELKAELDSAKARITALENGE